jgi:3-oxoadipate enol-lactonase
MTLHHTVTGSGPDIVLLHGVGLDHRLWDRCVPRLAEAHRVTAVDLRGHGASPPAAPGTGLGDLAADVLATLDTVGAARVHLVGFSLGALVAAYVAATAPERVATLALVSSVAMRTPEERGAVLARLEAARTGLQVTVEAAVDRWFDEEWQRAEPETVADVRRTMLANDPASYLACYTVFATGDADVAPLLAGITAPTLAVTGSDDPGSTPQMSDRLAAAIPEARAEVVVGARHLLPLERPRELSDTLLKHFERTRP